MADAMHTPRPIDAVLDGDDPIDVGYEAAAPWLQAHCRQENDAGRELETREAALPLRELRTESLA